MVGEKNNKAENKPGVLKSENEFFSELLNDMTSFISILTPDGDVRFVNNTFLDIAGLKPEDVIGKKFYDIYWWSYSEDAREIIKTDMTRCTIGEKFVHEIQVQVAEDSFILTDFSMHPVYDNTGNLKYLVAEGKDVTEKKKAMDDAKQKVAYLDNMPTYMAVTDLNGSLQFTSAVTIKKFGFKLEDVIGTKFDQMAWWDYSAEVQKRMGEIMAETVKGKKFEFEIDVRMGQELVPIKYTCDPLTDETGKIYALLHTGTRIDELKTALEEERKLSEAILKLSIPIIQVWDGVLLLPLIGTIDAVRAQQIVENLLETIATTNAEVVIIDLSGVPTVDSEATYQLIKTENAARMLGSRVIFTGLHPDVAQTMTQLGIDITTLQTQQNLRAGLQEAINIIEN